MSREKNREEDVDVRSYQRRVNRRTSEKEPKRGSGAAGTKTPPKDIQALEMRSREDARDRAEEEFLRQSRSRSKRSDDRGDSDYDAWEQGQRRNRVKPTKRTMTAEDRQRIKEERKRQKEEARKKVETLRRTNKEIILCTYIFVIIFMGLIGYEVYFMRYKSDYYRNNSYNSRRQGLLEEQCTRGDILASDGTVLAQTLGGNGEEEYRDYPEGRMFAHVIGYSNVGTAGLESQAGTYLLESHDSLLNQITQDLKGEKNRGDSVKTTLDMDLQEAAYDSLEDREGAIVVMDAETGAVLAMVSKPDFNPNTLEQYYQEMINDSEDHGSLVNRATQGLYPPGSTFKILTTLEYMREYPQVWKNFRFDCSGLYSVGSETIQCYGQTEHGEEDLTQAFAKSCNGAFAEIGQMLNFSSFYKLCENFGFNQSIYGVSMANSVFKLNNNKSSFQVTQTSIGQGETQVTPMLNCMIAASVANQGVMMKPYLVDTILTVNGDEVSTHEPEAYGEVMTKQEAGLLQNLMAEVVNIGTGSGAAGSGYTAYGKTGSAEVSKERDTDAWFIGYAVSEKTGRKIAVSIVVEGAGAGGSVAAPIARKIFETAFN